MNKRMLALIIALMLTLFTCALTAFAQEYITAEAARQAALTHAKVAQADAKVVRIKLEWEGARAVYEVEFHAGEMAYDYEIDALTDQVLKFDGELETKKWLAAADLDLITEEEAKAAALAHAQATAEEVTLVLVQLDSDQGGWEYEVEFYQGDIGFDYEIDAQTGEILSFDREIGSKFMRDTQAADSAAAGTDIGMDKAEEIALAHAGVAQSDVTQLRVEKDREDGRTVYEVEFKVGRTEYNYEIDAAGGAILEYEVDDD